MSLAGREHKASIEQKPEIVCTGQIDLTGIEFPALFNSHAFSDKLIMSQIGDEIFICDLAAEKPKPHSVYTQVSCYALSDDRQWLALLGNKHLRILRLENITNVDDFKKITAASFQLDVRLYSDACSIFFINDNLHLAGCSAVTKDVFIIDVNTGEIDTDFPKSTHLCPFGKDKLVFLEAMNNLIICDVESTKNGVTISDGVALHSEDDGMLDDTMVSADASLFATYYNSFGISTIKYFEIESGSVPKLLGEFSINPTFHFPPLFTCDNSLIYRNGVYQVYLIEYGSTIRHSLGVSATLCELPNGDIYRVNQAGAYSIIAGARRNIYQKALAMLLETLEIHNSVQCFPLVISKTVAEYLADSGLFSRGKKLVDTELPRTMLGKILDDLALNYPIKKTDKEILIQFCAALAAKQRMDVCVDQACDMKDKSGGLAWFLQSLQTMFGLKVTKRPAHR